jgi:hypothetical protein
MTDPPYQSALERHPDVVKAIGMANIEIGNLGFMFGKLLACLINKSEHLGQVIYHAPRGETARLHIVADVIKFMFRETNQRNDKRARRLKKGLDSWTGRARAVIGQRHLLIHSNWGLDSETGEIICEEPPIGEKPRKPFDRNSVDKLINDTRVLISEIEETLPHLHAELYSK